MNTAQIVLLIVVAFFIVLCWEAAYAKGLDDGRSRCHDELYNASFFDRDPEANMTWYNAVQINGETMYVFPEAEFLRTRDAREDLDIARNDLQDAIEAAKFFCDYGKDPSSLHDYMDISSGMRREVNRLLKKYGGGYGQDDDTEESFISIAHPNNSTGIADQWTPEQIKEAAARTGPPLDFCAIYESSVHWHSRRLGRTPEICTSTLAPEHEHPPFSSSEDERSKEPVLELLRQRFDRTN